MGCASHLLARLGRLDVYMPFCLVWLFVFLFLGLTCSCVLSLFLCVMLYYFLMMRCVFRVFLCSVMRSFGGLVGVCVYFLLLPCLCMVCFS